MKLNKEEMMAKEWDFLTADDYAKHICEVYGLNYKQVGRIVIDITTRDLVVIYVTLYGDKRLLEVRPPDPKEVRIVMESPDETQHEPGNWMLED